MEVSPANPAALRALLLVALLTPALAGCTAGDPQQEAPPSGPRPVATRDLDASITQFRFEEGTRELKAGVVNRSDREVRIDRATVAWPGFRFASVRVTDPQVLPGQAAAFPVEYGDPRCDHRPAAAPVLVARVDGRDRRLPLRVEDPGLLRRLWATACARERLDAAADVRLVLAARTVRRGGTEHLPGEVVVRRRPGSTAVVEVVDLGGSVLFDLVPRDGRDAVPVRLDGGERELRLPVLLGSAGRCDGHARGQSSQTFLLSVYVRLAGERTQRVITVPSTPEQERLLALLDRSCRG